MEPAYPTSHGDGAEGLVRPRKLEFAGQSTGQERPRLKKDLAFSLEYSAEYGAVRAWEALPETRERTIEKN